MTIKTLRKDYENLSMLQRLSLLDNAISRNDDSEAQAIMAASPRKSYSQPDYCDFFDQINHIRLCNLIFRLGYMMNFNLFRECLSEKLKNKSSLEDKGRAVSRTKCNRG